MNPQILKEKMFYLCEREQERERAGAAAAKCMHLASEKRVIVSVAASMHLARDKKRKIVQSF